LTASHIRSVQVELFRPDRVAGPSFLSKLERHIAWHLLKWFLIKHPLIAAQLGFSAQTEAARFTAGKAAEEVKRGQRNS
jgi:hypothetical protein